MSDRRINKDDFCQVHYCHFPATQCRPCEKYEQCHDERRMIFRDMLYGQKKKVLYIKNTGCPPPSYSCKEHSDMPPDKFVRS